MLTAYFESNLRDSMLLPTDTQNLFDQEDQPKPYTEQYNDLQLVDPLNTQFKLPEELHSNDESPTGGPYNHASSHVSPTVSNKSDMEVPLHVSEKSPVSHSSPHIETVSSKPPSLAGSGGESPSEVPNSLIQANTVTSNEEKYLKEAKHAIMELRRFVREAPEKIDLHEKRAVFELPNSEKISCVDWNQCYYMTGTDIVRSLVHRFAIFGRDVQNRKKFEEGVFSDLRNLKINQKSTLEESKSSLLEHLYKLQCVRTKKKQKVFFWNEINHEELFLYALSRELKKENPQETGGLENGGFTSGNQYQRQKINESNGNSASAASTVAKREPALSFEYDSTHALVDQVSSILKKMKPLHAEIFKELATPDPLRNMIRDAHRVPFSQQLRDYSAHSSRRPNGYEYDLRTSPGSYYTPSSSVDFKNQLRLPNVINPSRSPYQHPSLVQPRRHSLMNGGYSSMERYPLTPQIPQMPMIPNSLQSDATTNWDSNVIMPQRHASSPPTRIPMPESHYPMNGASFESNSQFPPQASNGFDTTVYNPQDGYVPIDSDNYVKLESDSMRNPVSKFNLDFTGPGSMLPADSSSIDSQSCLNGSLDTLVTNAGNPVTDAIVDDSETDFSLEVLAREDQDQRMLPTRLEKSFDAQYSEFVYQNRPALRNAQLYNNEVMNERPNDFSGIAQYEPDNYYMPSQDPVPQEWGQYLNADDLKPELFPTMNTHESSYNYRDQPLDLRSTLFEDNHRHYGTSGNSNGVMKRTNRKSPPSTWSRNALVEDLDSTAQWSNCLYDRY